MTLQGSQRRGFRRRMLQSSAATGRPSESAGPQPAHPRTTPYSKEARPENHPALATWLPTRAISLWAACLGVVLPIAVLITVAATTQRWLPAVADGSPWASTIGRVRECLSMAPRTGLAAWLSQLSLMAAACVAVSIRQMRRYRLDDYRGRYRAWGWLAGLALIATLERQLPLAAIVSSAISDASGIALGPQAAGWWLCVSAPLCLAAVLWAVLPMHERLFAGLAIASAGLAWLGATACEWLARGDAAAALSIAAGGLTLAGDGLLLVSMLVAARSVLREVRGETAKPERVRHPEPRRTERADEQDEPIDSHAADAGETRWSDGSETSRHDADGEMDEDDEAGDEWDGGSTRKLSKAEKKRLRKLSRMNRAA